MLRHTLSLVFLLSIIAYGSTQRCYVCEDTGSGPCFNENDGDLDDLAYECSAVSTPIPTTSEEPTVSTEDPTDPSTETTESSSEPTVSSEPTDSSSETTESSSEQTVPTTEPPTAAPTAAPTVAPTVFQVRQRRHVREVAEESYQCYVFFEGTGDERIVQRGCVSEADAATHCVERDDCRTCTGDLCNAAGSIKGSTAGIFALVIAVFLLYSN